LFSLLFFVFLRQVLLVQTKLVWKSHSSPSDS
jgi:hypothetical protein